VIAHLTRDGRCPARSTDLRCSEQPAAFDRAESGMPKHTSPMRVQERGIGLLANPLLKKGTAFTMQERDDLGLHGLVPTNTETIEQRADPLPTQLALLCTH